MLTSLLLQPLALTALVPLDTPAPGLDGVVRALGWLTWVVIVVCAGSFLVAVARIALALQHGSEFEGLRALLLTAGAAILAGSAAVLANALI